MTDAQPPSERTPIQKIAARSESRSARLRSGAAVAIDRESAHMVLSALSDHADPAAANRYGREDCSHEDYYRNPHRAAGRASQ